jgi:hypothetical protein
MNIKKIIALFLLLTLYSLNPAFVRAQTAQGLTAIPPRIEVTVKPGAAVTKEIKVRNDSNTPKTISLEVKDFIVSDELGTPIPLDGISETANRWAASTWVQISATKVLLKANETKALTVTIIVPDKATAGGHYAMILQTPDNADTTINGTGSIITTRVGTLLYITVPGNIKEDAKITNFSGPAFLEYGPVNFSGTFVNLSDVHIIPAGSVTITDLLGLKVGQVYLPETRIFPLTQRNIDITYPAKWLLGRFQAQLNAVYGTQGQLLTATLFFWVIPWRLIVLLIAAVIVLYFIVVITRRQTISSSEIKADKLEKELEDLKKKYKDRP